MEIYILALTFALVSSVSSIGMYIFVSKARSKNKNAFIMDIVYSHSQKSCLSTLYDKHSTYVTLKLYAACVIHASSVSLELHKLQKYTIKATLMTIKLKQMRDTESW